MAHMAGTGIDVGAEASPPASPSASPPASAPAADSVGRPEVLLGLGANLGDRRANIERAMGLLAPICGPLTRAPLYVTTPWGDTDQPDFLNTVARGHTSLPPHDLLAAVKSVERLVGRTASRRWGPRVVDVDILSYGGHVVDEPDLVIPHPRLHERAFVLVPLVELAPDWRHPVLGKTARELLAALPDPEAASVHLWQPI